MADGGVNLFDLAAKISVDAKGVDSTLTATQKKVLQLAEQFKKTEAQAQSSTGKMGGAALSLDKQLAAVSSLEKQRQAARLRDFLAQEKAAQRAAQAQITAAKQAAQAIEKDLGGAIQSVSPRFAALAGSAGPVSMAVAGLVAITAGAAIAGKAIYDFAISSANTADQINDMEKQLNLSGDTLQGLAILAKQSGTSIEQLAAGIGIFDKKVEEGDEAFRKMGITSRDTETALREAFIALGKIQDPVTQVATSMELFGRSGKSMLGVLKQADGDVDKAIQRFKQMGAVLDEDAIQKANEFNDKMAEVSAQIATVETRIGLQLLPTIISFANQASDLIEKNQNAITAWASAIRVAAEGAAVGLRGPLFVLGQITEALEYLASHNFHITYTITQIGGVPVPIPSGIGSSDRVGYGATGGAAGVNMFGGVGGGVYTPSGGGGGGRGGGGGAKAVDEYAEALKKQNREIDEAIKGTDQYQKEIDRLVESLGKKKKALTDTQMAQLMGNAETLRSIAAEKDYKDFMQSLNDELIEAGHTSDQWDKALKQIEKTLAKNHKTLADYVGLEHEDLIARLRLVDAAKKEAEAMQQLDIVRRRYAETIRNTRPRMVGVPENSPFPITDLGGGSVYGAPTNTPSLTDILTGGRDRRVNQPIDNTEWLNKMHDIADQSTAILSNAIRAGIEGGAREGFKSMLEGFLDMLAQMAERMLASAIFSMLVKVVGGGVVGIGGPLQGVGGGAGGAIGSFAVGSDYIPHDMLAMVHKGEKIVPAAENKPGRSGGDLHVHFHVDSVEKAGSRETQRQVANKVRGLQLHAGLTG